MVLMGTGLWPGAAAGTERSAVASGLGFQLERGSEQPGLPSCPGPLVEPAWYVRQEAGQTQTWARLLSAGGGFGWE